MSRSTPESSGAAPAGVLPLAARIQTAVDAARAREWSLAVGAATAIWALAVFSIVRDRYLDFRFARYDLGNMVQAVWSTAQGRPLETTDGQTGEQIVRLASHVDPILAALAPVWIVAPSPLALAAVQVVAVALGALPLYWLARLRLGSERVAAMLALAYLAYPWTAWAAVDLFHPVCLAIPLLLFCVWFLERDRLVPFAVCATLTAATGELMGLVVAALGIWYALARGRRMAGAAIACAGVGWSLIALRVVVPAFADGPSLFYGAYEHVGGSPWGVVHTAFTDPLRIVSAATGGGDLLYLFLLAAPLGGLFLLAPGLLLVALPQLGANLLADRSHTTDPHAHYVAGILPFLFAALAVGLARLSPAGRSRAALVVLVLSLATTVAVGPWPATLLGTSSWDTLGTLDTSRAHVRALEEAVSIVPAGAPVSATNRVGAHLADRRYLYSAPVVGRAEWVVLDVADTWVPEGFGGVADPGAIRRLQARLEDDVSWRKVFERDGVFVYQKTNA